MTDKAAPVDKETWNQIVARTLGGILDFNPSTDKNDYQNVTLGWTNSYNPQPYDTPDLARAKVLFIAAWTKVHGEEPSDATLRGIENATSIENLNAKVKIALDRETTRSDEVILAIVQIDNGEIRSASPEEIAEGWVPDEVEEGEEPTFTQPATGDTLTESELREQHPDAYPEPGTQLIEAILEGVPGAAKIVDRQRGFIGGLDAPTAYGIIDGKRVPVDANGLPLDPELFHQPQGIYNPNDPTNAGRIASGSTYPRTIEGGTVDIPVAPRFPTGDPYLATNVEHIQRYHYGFQWEPASWDPVERARIKDRLVKAGLLDEDDRSNGSGWSHFEAEAFGNLAKFANGTGEMWSFALGELERNPVGGGDSGGGRAPRAPFVAPSYLAPDMDLLKQAVKDSVRGRLGREPTAAEMGQLIVGLDSDYRSAYDVQVQASRSEYDATTRAIDTETAQSGGEFRNVDPASSFAERFELRFDNEIGFKKRRDDLNTRQSYTDATMRMIDSMVGGGG
jgi:hypothetical protein